jgi:2-polyprenyl-3-methyl-5-hydroxy-6-metoxy-1,4-benzoquinol methylase
VPALWIAASASYHPLGGLPDPQSLLDRTWPEPVEALLTQQIREPAEELRLRETMPRLTEIEGESAEKVRRQYEENPYPRWTVAASPRQPLPLEAKVRGLFPAATLRPLPARDGAEVLIAGCGTGEHPIGMARSLEGARVLAVDLSLASLGYALRKTRELNLHNIEYAQADLTRLAAIGRTFDLIDASGVLHHLAEPFEGWASLLPLLRPNGLMRIGLYSEVGRRDVVAAQHFAAERGFRPVADDIRRCRDELLDSPLRSIAKHRDFFTVSECRDLLFHVQEHRHSIPQIQSFLRERNLRFLGFETAAAVCEAYRSRFPRDAAMTDLGNWHALEAVAPETFASMYQFWIQRA